MGRNIPHVLTIVTDQENDEEYDYEIACPYAPDRLNDDDCPCRAMIECSCKLSDEQSEEVCNEGDGPCPESPDGRHKPLPDGSIGHTMNRCWVQVCDSTCDEVHDIWRGHGAGRFEVDVLGDWDGLELGFIRKLPSVSTPEEKEGETE